MTWSTSTAATATAEPHAARSEPSPPPTPASRALEEGRRVLRTEAEAVAALADRLGDGFLRAVELVASCRGRAVASGIGKSGLVARKVAATLTSTGTPAVFLHPVEGLHGDLGIVDPLDVMILVTKSGATAELDALAAFAKTKGVPVVALVGAPDAPLARRADAVLDCRVDAEACPLGLAPTTSSTAALAMGDALAVAVLDRRGFGAEDFARLHPGGSLGRRLTLRVEEVMESADYPAVPAATPARDVIVPLARMRGTVPVVGPDRTVAGVVTAGDLTRLMERAEDFLDTPVSEFMTRSPRTSTPSELGAAAVRRMQKHGIMAMPVVDADARLVGIVHLHDLLRSGAV